jgi:hypothetical protein
MRQSEIDLHDDEGAWSWYQIEIRVREMHRRVEGSELIVSNTDELGGGGMTL